MDEGRECSFTAYQNGMAMLRQPGFPHQSWLTSTPAGKDHWMFQIFHPGEYELEESLWNEEGLGLVFTAILNRIDQAFAPERC